MNAEEDEPIFVLISRDKFFKAVVMLWHSLAFLMGARPEKLDVAKAVADAGETYQTSTGHVKFPD